jgi:hypothetical protein
MVQVYFFLVLLNVTVGLLLIRAGISKSFGIWDAWFQPFENRMVRGLLGTATFVTGFLGLIFVLPGDQIFLGDLFPSLTALLGGTILALDYLRRAPEAETKPDAAPKTPSKVEDFLMSNRIVVGVICLTFGVIHFFAPTVVFL